MSMIQLINLIILALILELVKKAFPQRVFVKNYTVAPVRSHSKINNVAPLIRGQPKTRSGLINKQK